MTDIARQQAFAPGDRVFKITEPDRVGVVVGPPQRVGPVTFYPVVFRPPHIEQVVAENLALFQGQGVDSLLERRIFAGHAAFSRLVTFTKLSIRLSDTLYAFLASRTDLYAYQYKPLIKFLESTRKRLLIADEVGLGKTIEAGLILIEQRMREELQRVLVVCPASLRSKWREELARRFDEHFVILDKPGLKELLNEVAERGGATGFRAIVSFGPVRSRDVIESLEAQAPPLDLLIVDEAHHLRNPETLTHKAVRSLADAADAVLLLTATPIHLGSQNLLSLLRLLDPEEFDRLDVFDRRLEANRHVVQAERLLGSRKPHLQEVAQTLRGVEGSSEAARFTGSPAYKEFLRLCEEYKNPGPEELVELQSLLGELNVLGHVLSRSRKRDVQPDRPVRKPWVEPVAFTPLEVEVYQAATSDARRTYATEGPGSVATFHAITRQRQIASCLPAALQRFKLRAGEAAQIFEEEASDLEQDEWSDASSTAPAPPQELARFFSRIGDLESQDSKFSGLLDVLGRLDQAEPGRKLIIFSYFKDTLAYLFRRLTGRGFTCLVLTGDVPSRPGNPREDERAKVIKRFRTDPDIRVLLSSEVGSEGLDFQFCHILVNYDLPWNPMVVEQRIGRLDRLGQASDRIVIVNLTVRDTIENRILERLYERIGIFRASIGDLEPILGEIVSDLQSKFLRSELTAEELEELLERKAIALEIARRQGQELEEKSAELLGHDELFEFQIDRKRTLRQYVVADELVVFVDQFLKDRFPKARLRYDRQQGLGTLEVTDDLLAFVRRHTAQGDPLVHNLTVKAMAGVCAVTFEAERAAHDPDIEYLGSHHPLIQSIVRHYEADVSALTPVAAFGLHTESLEPGEYLYSLDLVRVSGVRARRYLDPTVVHLKSRHVVGEATSRELIGAIIAEGYDVPIDQISAGADQIAAARRAAVDELGRRIDERRRSLGRTNEQLADARLASLKASHEAKRHSKVEQLDRARAGDRPPHYVRMLEGSIRNLDAAFRAKVQEVERARAFDVSYEAVAAGILVVER